MGTLGGVAEFVYGNKQIKINIENEV